jgi:uncharacterized protein YegP (UPF0339 family)
MKKARFVVWQDATGQWRNRLIAPNGKIVLCGGEGYRRRGDARRALKWFDRERVTVAEGLAGCDLIK